MLIKKTFPAKILLFGEYTILNGSKALAIPYENLCGKWSFDEQGSELARNSHQKLKAFLDYCSKSDLNCEQLGKDLEKGLWFDSSIPHGHGLGSSGALMAAIYETYGLRKANLIEEKESLAKLEDFFHGSSSGIDPLVSLIQRPLLVHSFQDVEIYHQHINLNGFFLLDTKKPRNTGPLVQIYQEKMKDPEFKRGCAEVLVREVNFAIQALLSSDNSLLFHHLWLISKFQWEYFPEMIPTHLRGLWARGLESGDYVLKLCGAGGGGVVLGYSNHPLAIENQIAQGHEVIKLG